MMMRRQASIARAGGAPPPNTLRLRSSAGRPRLSWGVTGRARLASASKDTDTGLEAGRG